MSRQHPARTATISQPRTPQDSGGFRRPLNRSGTNQADWCRFENIAESDVTEVYIYDEIGMWGTSAAGFVDELRSIKSGNIDLHLNSPGGEVFDGTAIYNALVNHPATVTVYVDGLAASAASFIAQAGDEVVMAQGSTMMIHDAAGFVWGNASDLRDTADILDKISNGIASIYAERTGGTTAEWRALMVEEVWYTAKEAVTAGLADKVGGKRAAQADNKWDLSVFNHAGRSDAPSPEEIRAKVLNQVKESGMPKNSETGTEGEAVAPEAPTKTTVEVSTPAPAEGTPEAPSVVVTPAVTPAPTDKAGLGIVVNGVRVTDPAAIQAHINSLEGFRTETFAAARSSFVNKLASDNKITAAQVEAMGAFAQTLTTEQYEGWTATWNASAPLPLLARHAGATNTDGTGSANDSADRLEVVRQTVMMNKRGGMTEEQIKVTNSYRELMKLDPTFNL